MMSPAPSPDRPPFSLDPADPDPPAPAPARTPLGQMLVMYRAARGLTVLVLAAEVGISAATLSRIERGGLCDPSTLLRLLAWLFRITL